MPTNITRLVVTFRAGDFPPTTAYPDKARTPVGPLFSPAKGSKDANIYLSGIAAPAIGNKPLYSIDGKIDWFHSIQSRRRLLGYWGVKATAKTDSRPTADPDSFTAAAYEKSLLAAERAHLSEIRFHWDVGGSEFDKKGKTLNFMSAPTAIFSVPVAGGATIDFIGGAELGHNFRNRVTPDGLGFISRGLFGANGYVYHNLGLPGLSGARIAVTSSYQLRLPVENEPYTRGKFGPFLTTRARNSVTNTVDLMLIDYLGITLKHEYGALSPTFSFVEHKGSIGLTLQLKQNPRR